MALLQVEHLRPSVVELLSLMSLDPTGEYARWFLRSDTGGLQRTFSVRQTILLRIASVAFATGPENLALVGHVELLTQLISDGASSPCPSWFNTF